MNTFQTLTNALVNLETYVDDDASLMAIKDAISATIQRHPLVLSDQALVFNLRKLGEELHVTDTDQKVLTIRLAVVHPHTWSADPVFFDLARSVCTFLLPGMDIELSHTPAGDIRARTLSAQGMYPVLTPEDADALTALAMSAIVILHATNFSAHE